MEEVKLLACGLCRERVHFTQTQIIFSCNLAVFVPKPYKTSAKKKRRGKIAVQPGVVCVPWKLNLLFYQLLLILVS